MINVRFYDGTEAQYPRDLSMVISALRAPSGSSTIELDQAESGLSLEEHINETS